MNPKIEQLLLEIDNHFHRLGYKVEGDEVDGDYIRKWFTDKDYFEVRYKKHSTLK